jgi:ryanodine receptor 2
MSVYVPEKDMSFDVLEMIEHPDYLAFHRQTLNLYCKLCSQGNQKVAHILCDHIDQEQIMYAIKSHGKYYQDRHLTNYTVSDLSGPLRQGFHDLLISLHLKTHADARFVY